MPKYETDKDLEAEAEFEKTFKAVKWGYGLYKLSEVKYIIDYAVHDLKTKETVGFIEFRRRYNTSDKYPTIFCSVSKWIRLLQFSKYKWTAFFVQWDDVLMYLTVNDECKKYDLELNGRKDRDDSFDIEPNLLLEISDFREFK